MLSCFGGAHDRLRSGKRHKRRVKPAKYSEINGSSTASEHTAAAAAAEARHVDHGASPQEMLSLPPPAVHSHARSHSGASVPQPTTPRQAQRRPDSSGADAAHTRPDKPATLTVAVPSWASEASSFDAGWVSGHHRGSRVSSGSFGSFTSARSSFSSVVSSAQSDAEYSFRAHLGRDTGEQRKHYVKVCRVTC